MRKLFIGSALLAASVTANAAVYEVTLVEHLIGRGGNPPSVTLMQPAPTIPEDDAAIPMPDCIFDDVTEELSCTGTFHFRSQTNPSSFGRIFDRFIVDLNIVGGSAEGTTSYECVTGGFSQATGASFCGNYTWGVNFTNDSTETYGPGLAFSRDIQGDDVIAGDQQSINDYNLDVATFNGTGAGNLVLRSDDWLEQPQVPANSAGTQLTFDVGAEVAIAKDDGPVTAPEGVMIEVDVLANDVGFTDPVTVEITTPPTKGTAIVTGSPGNAADIRIEYTANVGAEDEDTFVYTVSDGDDNEETATVTLSIIPFGANDYEATTSHTQAVVIPLNLIAIGFTDDVELTFTDPAQGTVELTGDNPGPLAGMTLTYTPESAAGTDGYEAEFTYTIDDSSELPPDTGTVTITVTNSVPLAVGGTISLSTVGAAPGTLSGTFTAPGTGGSLGDGTPEIAFTQGSNGTVTLNGLILTYVPNGSFFQGTDTFTYTITDADDEESAAATVTVNIANATPTASGPAITVAPGGTGTSSLTIGAGNGPLAEHTVGITGGTQGSCTLQGTTVSYTANAEATGFDSCVVEVEDLDGSTVTATIGVTISTPDEGGDSKLPGGKGSLDLLSLALLGGLPLLRRRRRA